MKINYNLLDAENLDDLVRKTEDFKSWLLELITWKGEMKEDPQTKLDMLETFLDMQMVVEELFYLVNKASENDKTA